MLTNTMKQHVTKLQQKKYRYEFQEFIIEGKKAIDEAFQNTAKLTTIFIQEEKSESEEFDQVIQRAKKEHIPVYFVSKKDIKDIKTTSTYPGISAIVTFQPQTLATITQNTPIIVLDSINDPGNLGTIIRTADWFGFTTILLSENCVDPYNEKVVRSTMGSIFHMNLIQSTNIVQDVALLKQKKYKAYGFTMKGKNIKGLKKSKKSVYIFGSESHGIQEDLLPLCNGLYSIPGKGKAESLNVAVSAAVVMYKVV